jgi:uridine phosphorylase
MHHTRANTFVRLGGGAALGDHILSGDVIIASGVVRDDGMTRAYITRGFPAVSSCELVTAMAMAAEDISASYHIGLGRSGDSEHVGCGRPAVNGYFQPGHDEIIDYYNRAGVLYWDRESSAIVTLCALFGRRGGAVCSVDNNLVTGEGFTPGAGQENAIAIVFEGLAHLKEMDEEKKRKGRRYWIPEKI